MTGVYPTEELKQEVGDVPLYTHERALGVDIVVKQFQIRCNMLGVEYTLNESDEPVEINAVGSDKRVGVVDRKYIASWARRNLYEGARPK